MWRYRYTDEMYHANGFKYIDKIFKNGRWRYIYDQAVGAAKNVYGNVSRAATNAYRQGSKAAANAYNSVSKTATDLYNKGSKTYRDATHLYNRESRKAKRRINRAKNKVEKWLNNASNNISKTATDAYKKGSSAAKKAYDSAADTYRKGSSTAKKAYDSVSNTASKAYKNGSSAVRKAGRKVADWAGADEKKRLQRQLDEKAMAKTINTRYGHPDYDPDQERNLRKAQADYDKTLLGRIDRVKNSKKREEAVKGAEAEYRKAADKVWDSMMVGDIKNMKIAEERANEYYDFVRKNKKKRRR